ncbi:MAG: carboxylating nicotinate-nucleotide diphosphorylase [Candidatus Altiarchaeota archaeon]|nr:carboxylating nicotinate-nucleotide diphosphorylase [Candidatus Altiarchaeota archaeon]
MSENWGFFARDLHPFDDSLKRRAVQAFEDDFGSGDLTTSILFGKDKIVVDAIIVSKSDGVLAGILGARAILEKGDIDVLESKSDGDEIHKGDVIIKMRGPVQEILARERTVLNYLQRMSGIATFSRRLYKRFPKRVLFLRKCDPGLLHGEKRAVALGGCLTHRIGLFDGILIKENHLDVLYKKNHKEEAIREAILRADEGRKKIKKFLPIEIETRTLEEAIAAANSLEQLQGPNIIMLDNMSPKQAEECSERIRKISRDIIIEASGGITEDKIEPYLRSGADFVSTSIFVSKSGFLDMSLEIL